MIQFQPKPVPRPAPVIVPCLRSIAERMADDMREMAFAGENVSPETLRGRGWTDPVIKRIAPKAALIARRKSVRQVCEAGETGAVVEV